MALERPCVPPAPVVWPTVPNRFVASSERVKELTLEAREEGAQMVDNLERKDVARVALLGLSEKDMENLRRLREADGRVRNYAVLIRRLIAREAKAL